MYTKKKVGEALRVLYQEFGVPERRTMDVAPDQVGRNSAFMKEVRKQGMDFQVIKPERHNQNPAEGIIREIRRKWFQIIFRKKVPKEFWDYGMLWVCDTQKRTHMRKNQMDGGVPLEKITGEREDISDYLDFGFYDRVCFHENAGQRERGLGRWLGVSRRTSGAMSYCILKVNGYVVSQPTVQIITNLESDIS